MMLFHFTHLLNKRGPIAKIGPQTFEPGYLFDLRVPVSGETSEPGYLFELRMPVSGETFANGAGYTNPTLHYYYTQPMILCQVIVYYLRSQTKCPTCFILVTFLYPSNCN